jgi:predicted nucleic-acid-binding protein
VIALDTTVLVRFLVVDDVAQTAAATALVQRAIDEGEALHVGDVVLCELVWVLGYSYEVPRTEIVTLLGRLLHARHLRFADRDRVAAALDAFAAGKGDFADYVILAHAQAAGADVVATFDRALLKERGFRRP